MRSFSFTRARGKSKHTAFDNKLHRQATWIKMISPNLNSSRDADSGIGYGGHHTDGFC